ncbi:leucine-rich repeat-containing protein 52 [Mobula birostris]|uniref:leucine-rich repeat-containing protein 52 n=1 Tax=Mobula birostris TaxID=1983395 RepID=UPI003B27CCA4
MFLYRREPQGLLWKLLLVGVTLAADCPSMCICEPFKVTCKGKGLNAFPESLPLNTRHLDLSDNSISEINSLELNLLVDLVHLDCSHNAISEISKLDFLSGIKLVYLDFSYNALKQIGSTTLESLTNLIVLKVNNNKISEVQRGAFETNIGLRVLDLRNNNLSFFNVSLIRGLQGLKSVYLSGNPWDCQCTIKLLSQWLKESKVTFPDHKDTVCRSPKSMVGIPVSGALYKLLQICLTPLDYFDYIFFVMVGFAIFISGIIVASITGAIMVCLERHRRNTEKEDEIEIALYQAEGSTVRFNNIET